MSNGRDTRQQVLQQSDEQPIRERMPATSRDSRVGRKPRTHVIDPSGHIGVPISKLQTTVVIQLEMIVSVDQAGQDDGTAEIDHAISRLRSIVDAEDCRSKS
jgi:hypothetical protein